MSEPLVIPKRFSVEDYHRLIELGFLTEDDPVELIRGELVQVVAKGTPHSVCNTKLLRVLDRVVGNSAVIRGQEPVTLSADSEPEPDAVIVRGQADDYLAHHPFPEDVILLIEIASSTLDYDQTTKLSLYAENQIQTYWIVNLVANQLECYQQPYQDDQGKFGYRTRQIFLRNETVPLPGFGDVAIDLTQVFPGL